MRLSFSGRPGPLTVAVLTCGTLLLLFRAQPSGQQPGQRPPSSPAPQFRAGINAVVLDARVVDASGRFIRDLTRDDFRVFEDGVEQTLSTFELVDLPFIQPVPLAEREERIESDVATNDLSPEGRLYVLLLDDTQGPSGDARGSNFIRATVRQFIEGYLTDTDLTALVSVSERKELMVPFTNSRRRLLDAVDRFELGYGQDVFVRSTPSAMNLRATRPLSKVPDHLRARDDSTNLTRTLRSLAGRLEGAGPRRKAIVLFSPSADMLETLLTGTCGQPLEYGFERLWTLEREETRSVVQAAGRGNVTIYPLMPALPEALIRSRVIQQWRPIDWAYLSAPPPGIDRGRPDRRACSQGLGAIARDTGGFLSPSTPAAFARVVQETSTYYLLGYEPANPARDSRFRRIEIRTSRPDLHVVSRTGYVNQPSAPRRTHPRTPAEFADLLNEQLPVADLPLAMAALAFRASDRMATLNVVVETTGPLDANRTDALLLHIVAADMDGTPKVTGSSTTAMDALEAEDVQRVREHGGRFMHQLALKPGRYHLRTSVRLRDGSRDGSVHHEIVVPDFSKGDLAISDVALATLTPAQEPIMGARETVEQALGALPTTARTFSPDDTLRAYVEVYDNVARIAQPLELRTIVETDTGRRVFDSSQEPIPLEQVAAPRTYHLTSRVPLNAFVPGAYVLTIEASGVSAEPVRRRIPFTVRR